MYRLIIADGFCPRPYSDKSLRSAALGGTESAVVLLAEALSEWYEVTVLQHCREHDHESPQGVRYHGVADWRATAQGAEPSTVVVINSPKLLGLWARAGRHAALILWRHNFLGNRHRAIADTLKRYDAKMVCVSRFQRDHALNHAQPGPHSRLLIETIFRDRVNAIPNPVEVYRSAVSGYDPDQLIFCSSPHKGLKQVIRWFRRVQLAIPSLKLIVANPGYMADQVVCQRGVTVAGSLSRAELHAVIAQSLCVFYPQDVFVETFCLVAAEANALGTPVLAPAIGALPDVAAPSGQLLPDLNESAIVERLIRWRADNRPVTRLRPEFVPADVALRWHDLLGRSDKKPRSVVEGAGHRKSNPEALSASA